MSKKLGSIKNNELYILEEFTEEQPVDYNKLVSYLSLHGDVITTHNYFEDVNLHQFNTWSGNNSYWTNMVQDGTFLGNPIYRCEKYDSQTLGFFFKYSVTGLEHIQDIEEYVLTAIFKSSNSNETIEPLESVYQGGGSPWTSGNYTPAYYQKTYKYYIGNGWWRYIYIYKIDRRKITEDVHRNRFYFGFRWNWNSTGQYVWGTQPQLYIGTSKRVYQGIKSQYDYSGLRKYYDSLSFEQSITNQLSVSNMESYSIGYTGNVCGFSNNFDSRFGSGNWNTEIIYQDNVPIQGITKAQRIITKGLFNRNWDDGDTSRQNNFGYGEQHLENGKWLIRQDSSNHYETELRFVPQKQSGIIEVDITIGSSGNGGVVYQTTQWSQTNNTFAYYVGISYDGKIIFGKGSNSTDSGSWTQLVTQSTSFNPSDTVTLKVIFGNGSHKVYINDTLYIDFSDSTYTSQGGVGLRVYGSGSNYWKFDNFEFRTQSSLQGGWYSGNIGNTSGDIVYGVLLRLHYGEIQFGDLNTSSRLNINESYYRQHNKKLGEWIWQVGYFPATGGGRHLYQVKNTKADIQQIQIYNTNELLSYVDGSESISHMEIPVDQFNMFKDEMTVSLIYEPLSNKTHGNYPVIFTLNWWSSDRSKDWFGIYRGNGWSQQDVIIFAIIDGTRGLEYGKSISGINSRIGHKLFISMSFSSIQHKRTIYVRDLTTNEDLLEYEESIDQTFKFDKSFDYQRIGFLNLDTDQQNQKISDFHYFNKYFNKDEIKRLLPKSLSLTDYGSFISPRICEPKNILERFGPTQFETGQFGGIWSEHTQEQCQVSIVPRPFKKYRYSYYIKRNPNQNQSDGKDYNWGGLKLVFPDDGTWEEGKTYRLSFWYKGYSTNTIEIFFATQIGYYTKGVGLDGLFLPYITHSFTDEDGWQYYEQIFTIPKGFIYQTGTNGITYYCMGQLKIGYNYTNTDEYGTRLYINDLVIEKIDESEGNRKFSIRKDDIYSSFKREDSNLTNVYLVGTQYSSNYPENRTNGNRVLKINGNEIYNTTGRGLRLTVFDSSFNILSDYRYDVYGDDTQRTNLATQLSQIERNQYWQLTSFDQVNSNTNLTNQLQQMGSKIWPLSYRSPYQQFGRGQQIIYEDGAPYTQNYVSKQVLNFII